MKKIKRELAHVGMFGSDGTLITKAHLADLAATADGDCPVSLGHKLADWMPRMGTVKSVALEKNGESLVGEIEEQDLLADAREAGFYPKCSVGIKRRAEDGKHYLHHLAYLGAVPPKIRDLKVFADLDFVFIGDEKDVVEYADATPEERAAAAGKIAGSRNGASWNLDEVKAQLERLFGWAERMALTGELPPELLPQVQQLSDRFETIANQASKKTQKKEGGVDPQEKNLELEKQLADANVVILKTAKDGLVKTMEGRIPKGKQDLVLALADSLGPTESIELSDSEGKKETVTRLDVLKRILESIPVSVREGKTDLGDPGENGKPADMAKIMSRV